MKIKFDQIFNAFKIGLGVFTSLATGKVAKRLEKIEQAVIVADAVRDMIDPPKPKPRSRKKQ